MNWAVKLFAKSISSISSIWNDKEQKIYLKGYEDANGDLASAVLEKNKEIKEWGKQEHSRVRFEGGTMNKRLKAKSRVIGIEQARAFRELVPEAEKRRR